MVSTKTRPTKDIDNLRDRIATGTVAPHSYVALLGLKEQDTSSLVARINRGLSFAAFERFQRNVMLSGSELASLLQIPTRTLSRRKEQGRLKPDESDRLVRISRIVGKALELFEGDFEGARGWLATSNPALGDVSPIEMSETEVGVREVESLMTRLEYGVFT